MGWLMSEDDKPVVARAPKARAELPKPEKRLPVQRGVDETVWIHCRATKGCEGNQAKVVLRHPRGGGGFNTRYKCLSCRGSWHIGI